MNEMREAVFAFISFEQMKLLQNYESLANIVSMALGGDKSKEKDKGTTVQSRRQLEKLIGKMNHG